MRNVVSEVFLDRVRSRASGDLDLAVRITTSRDEPPPSSATVRLTARESSDSATLPASMIADGAGKWIATCEIAPEMLDALGEAAFLDFFVDVTFGETVVSTRLRWPGEAGQWLPYPTATRKLSLTKVTG